MKYIILLIYLLTNCAIQSTTSTNINIQKKNANILGINYNYALADIELDQDLYMYDWISCPAFDIGGGVNSDPIIDCTCDFTVKSECPKALDPSCPPCPTNPNFDYQCSEEWQVLQLDTLYTFTISEKIQFRYKANSTVSHGFSVHVKSVDGYGIVEIGSNSRDKRTSVSQSVYSASNLNYIPYIYSTYQRNYHFNICPSDNTYSMSNTLKNTWTNGTYYIQVSPVSGIESYTFTIILHSIPIKPSSTLPTTGCSQLISTHECIELNKPKNYIIGNSVVTKYYTLQITKANYYYFNFPQISVQPYIFISSDPTNQFPDASNSTWSLVDEGDKNLMLYLEPISDTEPLNLYISLDAQVLGNIGTFSINDYALKYQYSISSLPSIQAGYLALRGTSKLIINDNNNNNNNNSSSSSNSNNNNNNNVIYNSPTFIVNKKNIGFSILYPQNQLNPLWPPSEYIFNDIYIKIKNQTLENHQFKPKSYQISFLLDQQSTTEYIKYQDFNAFINNSKLIFNSNIFKKDGLPFKLEIKFNNSNLLNFNCSYSEYFKVSQLVDEIRTTLFNLPIEEIDQTTSLIYNLNSLLLGDSWINCNKQVNSFYQLNTSKATMRLKNCPYDESNPLFDSDPCCSELASYYQCCIPSLVSFESSLNTDLDVDRIGNQCSSTECTASVFSDYNRTTSTFDECSIPESTFTNIQYNATVVMRECKSVLNPPFCSSDLDCINYGSGKCSYFNQTCLPDFQVNDKQYIECILSNLSGGTLYYLLNGTTLFNSSTIEIVYNQHLASDCIGTQSILERSVFAFKASTTLQNCNLNLNCLDETCLLYHDVCFDGSSIYLAPSDESYRLDFCDYIGDCPYKECQYTKDFSSFQSCLSQCPETSFCGYCTSNETNCHNIIETTTQSECETLNQGLCLLSNGKYSLVSSKEECNSIGSCSAGCGKECKSAMDSISDTVCYLRSIETQSQCNSLSPLAKWNVYYSYCYYLAQNETECKSIGSDPTQNIWTECSSKSISDGLCYGPEENLILCKAVDIPCKSKDECLNAGKCSDQYYFSDLANLFYSSGMGKCVHNHTYSFTSKTKSCGINEKDSPLGCYDSHPSFRYNYNFNKTLCESIKGYKWWTPAASKEECLSYIGCKTQETETANGILPFNFKFNEMSKEECLACEDSLNQWTNKFEWTTGEWTAGIYIDKPKWYTRGFLANKVVKDGVFDYRKFYSTVMTAVNSQLSELSRAESFCRIERLQSSLNSLVCSCFGGDGGSICFNSTVPILGQIKVCSDETSQFKFDFGLIEFNKRSIQSTCQIFSISQVTKEIYSSYIPESLASNFVSYNKPDGFAVLNSKSASVGTLLSDGIMFTSKDNIQLNNVTICFKSTPTDRDLYPIIDIAVQIDQNSVPIPLGLELEQVEYIDQNEKYYCGIVEHIPNTSPIYFKINRLENWQSKNQQLFNDETKGLMYTLAIILSLVSAFGIYESLFIIYNLFKNVIKSFQPIQLLIFSTTLFISIRAIYFFLLVNGKLQNEPVLDYILVVLPTFIYFTSFTIIISIWFIIVYMYSNSRANAKFTQRFYLLILLINLILYVFFICVVVVYQYSKFEPNNICGSRIFIPNQASNTQKAISLAYAIVQASLSLIIGAAFIYLGKNLYDKVSSSSKGTSKSSHQSKIFIISIICSIGFLLHCAFVLILVTNIDSMLFSFIGLLVTEVIPTISIFYCFNPNSISKHSNFKPKHSHKLKKRSNNNNNNNSNNNSNNNNNSGNNNNNNSNNSNNNNNNNSNNALI